MKIIEIYVSLDWDAQTHRIFSYAPPDWDTMTEKEREKFERDEVESYLSEHLDAGVIVHDSPEAAEKATRRSWGDSFDESMCEDLWDGKALADMAAAEAAENAAEDTDTK